MRPRPVRVGASSFATKLVGALAIAVSLASCSSCEREPPPGKHVADLVSTEGQVTLTRAKKSLPATAPAPLNVGDVLTTGADSGAVLKLLDGRELEIGEGARFVLGERPGQITLEVQEGIVISRAAAAPPSGPKGPQVQLVILTPTGMTRLDEGSEAEFQVDKQGRTVIEVRTGEITIVGSDGAERKAGAGEKVEILLGKIELVQANAPDAGEAAPDAGSELTLEPIEVQLVAERGAVMLKNPADKKFRAVGKKPEPVAAESSFKLARNASASLQAPGLRVQLAGGREGSVGAAVQEATGRKYAMRLGDGQSQVFFTGEGHRELALSGPKGEVTLSSEAGASFEIVQDKKGVRAQVQAGEVAVTFGGETKTVKGGDSVVVAKKMAVASRARPAMALPAGRNLRIFVTDLREVALTWPDPGDEPLDVQVATDAGYQDLQLAGRVRGNMVVAEAPRSGSLYWRALKADGKVHAAGHARFSKEEASTSGGSPHNEVNETGLAAVVYYQSALPSLAFNFQPVEGAAKYRFRVFRTSDLQQPLVDQSVAERRCEVEAGKLTEGNYVWFAAALDSAGAELAGGKMNKLEIVYDNAMTSLIIERPKAGEAAGREVLCKGIAPLGSKLFVNGKSAPLDAKGRFELSVPRAPQVVFRLLGDKDESYWTRSLRVR